MRFILCAALLILIGGCGGDSTTKTSAPPEATALQSYLQNGVATMALGLNRFDALLPFLVNPGSPPATGLEFGPDTTTGAPPYSYMFSLPLDGDGDGTSETTVSGRTELNGDPSTAGIGFGGTVELTVTSVGGIGDLIGNIAFVLTNQGTQLSGTGVFSELVTGNTTQISVGLGNPLLLKAPVPGSGSVANACVYSLDGSVQVGVTGPTGTLSSLWGFLFTRRSASITQAVYTDPQGAETRLSNSSVDIPCGEGSIQDWQGVFLQDWSCVPSEYGQALLTITVTGPNTIHVVDEDPPGSGDLITYDLTADSGRPHVVRGHFITSGVDAYREDLNWTLTPDGKDFSQVSIYKYQATPSEGGFCASRALRQP